MDELLTAQISVYIALAAFIISILTAIFTYLQVPILKQTNMLPILVDMFKEFRDPEFKKHQKYIFNKLRNKYDPTITGCSRLPEPAKSHVMTVSHFFDNLGLLVATGFVNENLVLSFLGGSVDSTWKVLEPFIKQERTISNFKYQCHFEHLVALSRLHPQSSLIKKLKLKTIIE